MAKLVFKSYSQDSYCNHFDGAAFAKSLIGETKYAFRTTLEDFLHKSFAEGKLKGTSMLDIGCGPTVRGAISASAHVPEIYLADLVENNREQVENWLKNSPDAPDCSWEFEYIASLEKTSDIEAIENRVRKAIKAVLPCDFLKPNPLEPMKAEFDIITAALTLDCLTDVNDYKKAVKNIASILKPGGQLAVFGIYGSPNYIVGEVEFPSSPLTEKDFRDAMSEAGLQVVYHDIQNWNVQYSFTNLVENTFCAISKKIV